MLIFLSALTLALVLSVTLPSRVYVRYQDNQKIVSQVMAKKVAKKLVRSISVASKPIVFANYLTIEAFRPWTVVASPRAPPA